MRAEGIRVSIYAEMINWLKNKLRKWLDIPTPEQYAKEVIDISLVLVQNIEANRQLDLAKKEFLETCQRLENSKNQLEKADLQQKENLQLIEQRKQDMQKMAESQLASAIEISKAREKAKRKVPPFIN